MTTQLSFSVSEQLDAETDKPVQHGTFSRDWAEEEELDELIDSLEAGRISHKQGLLRAQKLLVKFPGQLEIQNFIANRLWSLEMRDESTDVREKAYRMLLGDISLMTGDTKSAMKSYLKEATDSPAHWYQAGQIAFRISSRGIAANPYIAEGLTGRTKINEHLYWHASNRNGPDWATDYLSAPVCDWTAHEIDFVDWVFNSSAVLRERASLMEQHEGLTYERDSVRREPFALRSSYFVNELTDDLSMSMVKMVQNRYGLEIWPWERAGFTRSR